MFGHESVVVRRGPRSGLPVIVAIHSSRLGPAAGGCRMYHYDDWRDGLTDALRLSEAMSYKFAVAGLPYGGGKSVIAVPKGVVPDRRAALEDLGELIESLGGAYLAAPDVGTSPADMVTIKSVTDHVFCLPEEYGGAGSSSFPTAVGVLAALKAAAREVFGDESVKGRRILVSGLGSVGLPVAESLAEGGATLILSDLDEGKRTHADRLGADWAAPGEIPPVDIFVPAAVGGVLSPESVAKLDASLVIGPANNQLTAPPVADLLAGRGIVWVPDFVASAGGAIYVLAREIDGLGHEAAIARVETIGGTVTRVLGTAKRDEVTPYTASMALAAERLGML
jgi:leucine dehydrogenase